MAKKRLEKIECEICGEKNKKILHFHHLVERVEINSNNSDFNLACICPSCHAKSHLKDGEPGKIKILGVWPSTGPQGRMLVYISEGVCNVPGFDENTEPYYVPKNNSMRYYEKTTKEKE